LGWYYLETARGVTTLSPVAEEIVDGAFVDVRASFAGTVHLVSGIANTTIRAQQVLAGSVRANVGILSAFVDI
jgi:hypothetical protein